ncbi:MAG: hypothetical protein DMF93_09175 [Acidobacteria bacterium]|nr:MAG: hypothetical protein DMF93_09175 [Acidobacteriota bacterium]
MARWLRLATIGTLLAAALDCGSNATPPAPSPPPIGAYAVSGLVADLPGGRSLASATISITSGPNASRTTSSDGDGHYSLSGLVAGAATLHASAPGYVGVDDAIMIPADKTANFRLPAVVPPPAANPQCDTTLWPHMHDVQRIKIVTACVTVTGVIATVGSSDDGDIDMALTLDAGFGNLLNSANVTKLNGNLQIEAICQAPVHADVPDAQRTCANFNGAVPIPAVGTHVRVTGVYVLDSDHGWMEIHPISVMTAAP